MSAQACKHPIEHELTITVDAGICSNCWAPVVRLTDSDSDNQTERTFTPAAVRAFAQLLMQAAEHAENQAALTRFFQDVMSGSREEACRMLIEYRDFCRDHKARAIIEQLEQPEEEL